MGVIRRVDGGEGELSRPVPAVEAAVEGKVRVVLDAGEAFFSETMAGGDTLGRD